MNEDFVPFELAVKLKEKGYPQCVYGKYHMLDACYVEEGEFFEKGCITEAERAYTAPTIPQVLKWLREEKKIVISIFPHSCGWQADIYKDVHQYYDSEAECYLMYYYKEKTEISHSYNWLKIYCILYVLDNLI